MKDENTGRVSQGRFPAWNWGLGNKGGEGRVRVSGCPFLVSGFTKQGSCRIVPGPPATVERVGLTVRGLGLAVEIRCKTRGV